MRGTSVNRRKERGLISSTNVCKGSIGDSMNSARVRDGEAADTGNEHFLVFDGPDGSLMAVWTQSSVENYSAAMPADQHIAFARSAIEQTESFGPGLLTFSRSCVSSTPAPGIFRKPPSGGGPARG